MSCVQQQQQNRRLNPTEVHYFDIKKTASNHGKQPNPFVPSKPTYQKTFQILPTLFHLAKPEKLIVSLGKKAYAGPKKKKNLTLSLPI